MWQKPSRLDINYSGYISFISTAKTHVRLVLTLLWIKLDRDQTEKLVSVKHGLRTADYGVGIKHGLRYKTRTKHYELGIKYGLRYKTRTADYMWPTDCGLGRKHGQKQDSVFTVWVLITPAFSFTYVDDIFRPSFDMPSLYMLSKRLRGHFFSRGFLSSHARWTKRQRDYSLSRLLAEEMTNKW